MFARILGLFRGHAAVVKGTSKLAEGYSKKIDIGDPLAGGKQVVLCRVKGQLYALDALCPHAGGRIAEGPLFDGKHAVCPLHNYLFEPATGRAVRGACPNAKTYKVKESGGDCEIWV
jgi:nitrite reductase/ring-hydroxylating ferredoxin subunit